MKNETNVKEKQIATITRSLMQISDEMNGVEEKGSQIEVLSGMIFNEHLRFSSIEDNPGMWIKAYKPLQRLISLILDLSFEMNKEIKNINQMLDKADEPCDNKEEI